MNFGFLMVLFYHMVPMLAALRAARVGVMKIQSDSTVHINNLKFFFCGKFFKDYFFET